MSLVNGFYDLHPIGTVLVHPRKNGGSIRTVVVSGASRNARPRAHRKRFTRILAGVPCHYGFEKFNGKFR